MALLWVLLAIWVLWIWLSGHWFGRVLAFLLLATLIGVGGLALGGQIDANLAKPLIINNKDQRLSNYERFLAAGDSPEIAAFLARTGAAPPENQHKNFPPVLSVLGLVVGVALAWPLSGLPRYYRRRRAP